MPKNGAFYDINGENGESRSSGEMSQGTAKTSGCFVSVAIGFVLTLLAILIAVGVGLIVHFAEKDSSNTKDISCGLSPQSLADFFRQMQQAQTTASPTQTGVPSTTLTPSQAEDESYRLPPDLEPLHYDLELAPDIYGSDPSAFSFRGHVNITLQCHSPTSRVILNAKNLSIAKTDIMVSGSSGNLEVVDMALNDRFEKLKISLGEELRQGETYRVQIAFSGPLTDDLAGLYLSSYKRGNETVYLATTQFESPDAREAFPCFDEPAFKANFSVTLLRKPPLVSLSNTPIKRTLPRSGGWVADVYETTPRMSTYLLAFVVCDFVHVNGTTDKGIQFGIWARRELADRMEYALQTGMVVLDYYSDLFGTDFPLKKQDMIAMPDFAAGAMENWGLIIYREKYLLYKENVTSEKERQRVTLVIAHELAHQWFGNLVTLAWWDDLWLNEGFAEFVEYIGMDRIDPSWKVWEQFNIDAVQYVFEYDQIVSSHPLFSPAKTVEEMEQYFDSISYEKGASVIRMIEFCLGQDTFRRGLQRYLREHQYSNAHHDDLWNALADQTREEQKDLDIADIMNTWTLQMGFPLVTARRNFQGDVIVSQKRFLINPEAKDPGVFTSDYGYQWHVPITMTSSAQPQFNVTEDNIRWLSKDEKSKTLRPWVAMPQHDDPEGWFLVNVQQKGYYRVNYDDSNWKALVSQLQKNHTVISAVNRAQIIDDAWNLASAEELSVEIALSTLEYLEEEEDYVPWAAADKQMTNLKTRMTGTSGYGAISRFIQDRTRPLFAKLGLDDTGASALESYTRTIAVRRACRSRLPQCLHNAVQLFKQWRKTPDDNPISPSLRQEVYCTALEEGDEDDWLFVLTRFRQETSPADKDYLMRALTCTARPWLLNTLLNMSLSGKDIRRDDATTIIAGVAINDVGTKLAWDFVRANWDVILRDFAQSNSRLSSMFSAIADTFRTEFHHQELLAFINSQADLGSADRILRQAVETVEFNMKWYQNSFQTIVQWLAARGYNEFEGTETKTQPEVTPENVRLPTNLRPLHYDLTIEPNMYDPDPSTFTYNGTVALTFYCVEPTDRIVLHMKELHVSNVQLRPASPGPATGSGVPRTVSQDEDKTLEFLIIRLYAPLSAGLNYTVTMEFSAPLDTVTLSGFYLSSYRNASGDTVYLATTQFEPTDARRAFPCMDEPALKASFSIQIVRRSFNLALSNMPVKSTTNLGGERVMDTFQRSRPMSTYLVAFVVCDFGNKTKLTRRNVTYEVWARKEAVDQDLMDFALDFGVQTIDYYEDYFGVEFPLPKQSMIAIPDIAGGAMENWGLITYRETSIMLPPGQTSTRVATTVAHELGHQWFGDLVSPVWWDELWLNEGFATFLSYVVLDHLKPQWKQFEDFITSVVQGAMSMDGRVTSHPVYVPVATPAEINEIFDSISYDKGASIIRMIRFAIGEDTFKRGLSNYLNALKYKSASHDDLWNALDAEASKDSRGINVSQVMDTWTLQMNYPVVMVTVQGDKVTLTQERFLQDPTAKDPGRYHSTFGYKWDIPFTFTTSDAANFSVQASDVRWLMREEASKTLVVPGLKPSSWLLGNVGVMGYYRVNYDADNWRKLAQQLVQQPQAIGLLNRAQIIDDAWNLASGGYISQDIALSMLDYLDKEEEYVPWVAANRQLSYMGRMLSSTETYGAFKSFMTNKTSTQYNRFGMTGEVDGLVESELKSLLVWSACDSDGPDCVQDALTLFHAWKNNPSNNTIPASVRSAVYCTALRHGGAEEWQFLYEQFLAERDVGERDRLQGQLACTSQLWLLRKLLNRALYSGDIRSQDALGVLSDVTYNPAGTSLAWDFVRTSWDHIMQRYRTDPFSLKRLITSFGLVFSTSIQLQEMEAFVDSHPDLGVATRAFQAALESTRTNIRWMEKNYDTIRRWLDRQGFTM